VLLTACRGHTRYIPPTWAYYTCGALAMHTAPCGPLHYLSECLASLPRTQMECTRLLTVCLATST